MQTSQPNDLEVLWDQLLSREPEKIQNAFQRMTVQEQRAVLAHLERMINEPDWHPEQRVSAQAAIKAISGRFD